MNSDDLLDVIGEVKDEWILDAKSESKKKNPISLFQNKAFRTVAACFAVFFLCLVTMYGNSLHFGGSGSGDKSAFTGHDPEADYENYFGPAFPLTMLEENEFISARRRINYDFSIYSDQNEAVKGANVTEHYQLHNNSAETVKIKAVYPFVGRIASTYKKPQITVNGIETDYEIYNSGEVNYSTWRTYYSLFADNHYLNSAIESPVCKNQKVTVYEFSGFMDKDDDYPAHTLYFNYKSNPVNSKIMAWGFNYNGYYSETSGNHYASFHIKDDSVETEMNTKFLIVIGDDLEDYSITSIEDKEWIANAHLKDSSASITRKEMNLDDIIDIILREEEKIDSYEENNLFYESTDSEQFRNVVLKEIDSFIHEKKVSASYDKDFADLESIFHNQFYEERVFYLIFDIEISSENVKDIKIHYFKQASNSYTDHSNPNKGIDGYEMMTNLGTNLSFAEQAASISGFDSIEIIRQNFGFDIESDITEVKLDMEKAYYYLEVRNKENIKEPLQIDFTFLGFWPIFLFFFILVVCLLMVVKIIDKKVSPKQDL